MSRFFLVLALLCPAAFASAQTVTIRSAVTVSSDTISLGDVFSGVGDLADVPIAQAPAVGRSLVLDAAWLQDIARTHKFAWRATSRFERVVVERASHAIEHDQILAALSLALARTGAGGGREISFEGRQVSLVVAAADRSKVEIRDLRFDARSERFTAVAAAGAASVPLSGLAARMIEVPTVAVRLNRGEVVRAKDLRPTKVRAGGLNADAVTAEGEIVGKAVRRTVSAGEILRAADLQNPIAIERGALVTMTIQTPFMTLTTQGKALDEGALGDTIRVLNGRSKKIVEAQIARADTVVVPFVHSQMP